MRRPVTVLVVTEAGHSIGFNPARPLDRAIRNLAAEALATGQTRPEHLRIGKNLCLHRPLRRDRPGPHVMHVRGGDRAFASMLRYLNNGAEAVLIIGVRGAAGRAVVGADRVVGQPDAALPVPVLEDARRIPSCRRTISRI